MSDAREDAARLFEQAGDQLQLAADHCRVAAQHLRDGVIPRGAAHAWAARGHILGAEALLDKQAREHASRSFARADAD